jgi:hypothetical protein
VVGGAVFALMGAGAFFVPAIVNIEQNHNEHVIKDEPLPSIATRISTVTD